MKREELIKMLIYDVLKLKENILVSMVYTEYFSPVRVNPLTTKLFNLNLHPLEVVSR